MTKKAKLLSLAGTCITAISTAIVFIVMRVGHHAVTVGKVAATSGVLAAVAAPLFMSDKANFSTLSQFIPFRYEESHKKVLSELIPLLAEGKCRKAIQVFEVARKETAKSEESSLTSLVNAWVFAASYKEVPQKSCDLALDYITKEFPVENISGDCDFDIYGGLAIALWVNGQSGRALDYSMAILKCAGEVSEWQQENYAKSVIRVLKCIDHLSESDVRYQKARDAFVTVCMEVFAPGQVGLSNKTVQLYGAIAVSLLESSQTDIALDYLRKLLDHAKGQENASALYQDLVVCVVPAVFEIAENVRDERIEQVLALTSEYVPTSQIKASWMKLADRVPDDQKHSYCLDLLNRYGSRALVLVPTLLVKSQKHESLHQILLRHCELISYEIEAGVKSQSLEYLVSELRKRNANKEIMDVTEFLWKTFPAELTGTQALGLWIRSQQSAGGQAAILQNCIDLVNSYPGLPIAQVSRMAVAGIYISQGQAIEGLLLAEEGYGSGHSEQTSLTLSSLLVLVNRYVELAADAAVEIDRQTVLIRLADQLNSAGELDLAILFYWQVAELAGTAIEDPRTGLPVDPPEVYSGANPGGMNPQVEFWRSLALAAVRKEAEAVGVMEQLLAEHPRYKDIDLVYLFLTRQYYKRGDVRKAWKYVTMLSQDMRNTGEIAAIYAALAVGAPNKERATQNKKRIEKLEATLLNNPQAPNADTIMMDIGKLLLEERKYAAAVLNFEAVVRQYPKSSYCPEALFQQIMIYKNKIPNEEQVEQLTETLRIMYPKSRYALILN